MFAIKWVVGYSKEMISTARIMGPTGQISSHFDKSRWLFFSPIIIHNDLGYKNHMPSKLSDSSIYMDWCVLNAATQTHLLQKTGDNYVHAESGKE